LAPEASRRAARAEGPLLAHVIDPELAQAAPAPGRLGHSELLIALRDFVVAAARGLDLVVAVDDADRIDHQSAALLVSLAQRAERRATCLVLTVDGNGPGS